ncbi:hypothetical protein Q428_05670 [Fervidicella metallireducens AeB]|uniref:N-acetyltransferase domain-containing protein n=1 Tax=Fervidicella metallireducens AeB TaxID=1403537 RepID=A0A017RWW4_9CLOT|nr:GNAT family N-acetyltransferase [Fervidicella metallireducens]EYE88899.1 hypothetical protein Q428_05670 [Fervidicella metallireducens AeB]
MEVRFLHEIDKFRAKELWGYSFENEEPFFSWYFDEVFKTENTIGIFENNQLMSCLQMQPYILNLNGTLLDATYIVGVVTAPEYRGNGAIKKLIPRAIKEINDRGHCLSILMPFDTTFYNKYGWGLCYSQIKYEIPIEILSKYGERKGIFFPIDFNDINDLNRIYKLFLRKNNGFVERDLRNWEILLKDLKADGGYAFVLRDIDGTSLGYIFYIISQDKIYIRELAWVNEKAKKSLLFFISNHSAQISRVEWNAPLSDITYLMLRDTTTPKPTNIVRIVPFMCGRVINVKEALSRCRYDERISFSYTLKINDKYADWNNKTLSIVIDKGNPKVYETEMDNVDIECDIKTFSQLYFGALSINEALEIDNVKLHNENKLSSLGDIFTKKNNYINEYF